MFATVIGRNYGPNFVIVTIFAVSCTAINKPPREMNIHKQFTIPTLYQRVSQPHPGDLLSAVKPRGQDCVVPKNFFLILVEHSFLGHPK